LRSGTHGRGQVSHKTCRFYFILEKTNTTLEEYLMRCMESDEVGGGRARGGNRGWKVPVACVWPNLSQPVGDIR